MRYKWTPFCIHVHCVHTSMTMAESEASPLLLPLPPLSVPPFISRATALIWASPHVIFFPSMWWSSSRMQKEEAKSQWWWYSTKWWTSRRKEWNSRTFHWPTTITPKLHQSQSMEVHWLYLLQCNSHRCSKFLICLHHIAAEHNSRLCQDITIKLWIKQAQSCRSVATDANCKTKKILSEGASLPYLLPFGKDGPEMHFIIYLGFSGDTGQCYPMKLRKIFCTKGHINYKEELETGLKEWALPKMLLMLS